MRKIMQSGAHVLFFKAYGLAFGFDKQWRDCIFLWWAQWVNVANSCPHKYSNTNTLSCMFCTAINAFICALCTVYVCTPTHHEPIKAQTANLGVSPLNYPTNERLPYSRMRLTVKMTDCERNRVSRGQRLYDLLWLQKWGFIQIKWWGIFPIVPKRFRAPICLHFAAVFWWAGAGERSHEAFGGERREGEEMKEEWGGLSHIWRPEMEQNSMNNIWNSNCIM